MWHQYGYQFFISASVHLSVHLELITDISCQLPAAWSWEKTKHAASFTSYLQKILCKIYSNLGIELAPSANNNASVHTETRRLIIISLNSYICRLYILDKHNSY